MSAEEQPKRGLFGRLFRKEHKQEPVPEVVGQSPMDAVETGGQEEERAPKADRQSMDEAEAAVQSGAPTVTQRPLQPSCEQEVGGPEPDTDTPPGIGAAEEAGSDQSQAGDAAAPEGLFRRLRKGLAKTRSGLIQKVDRVLLGKKEIDADTLDELEEALVTADLGVQTSSRLIEGIQEKVSRRELTSPDALRSHLREEIRAILIADEGHFELGAERPQVVMVVGVNGVGKTTTIGKLAAKYRSRGHKVVLAAGDTFRAAAIEQLEIWGERVGAQVVRHQHGSDPAAVAFDAVEAAKARGADLVIVDTAGRLHTKSNLMEELKKVKRVIGKAMAGAPHQVLLVLDATTGQNAISQARIFREAVGVDGIALTKLDGTAKGGVIVGICAELGVPVQFIGIGEQVEDLRPFKAEEFVEALF